MILFEEDWYRYPSAIVDLKTKNKSFLRLAGLYKHMGIKNHTFLLALHDPDLQGIDPHDENLTDDLKLKIAIECNVNPWYYFREVMVVPAVAGNKKIMFRANRANIATIWLALNHITSYLIQPRQTGKSLTGDGLDAYMINTKAINTNLSLVTKDEKLRTKTSLQVREIISKLPRYLQLLSKKDIKNNERITVRSLGNSMNLYIGRNDKKAADNLGRGMASPLVRIDEFAYIYRIDITLPVLLAATVEARNVAKESNSPYYTLFTTTPGKLNTTEGKYAHEIYKNSVRWSEKFLDLKNNEELIKVVKRNTRKYEVVLLEFNHKQLGYTDEWLANRVRASLSTGENAESDFFMKWTAGSSHAAIPKNLLEIIVNSRVKEPNIDIFKHGYIINWMIDSNKLEEIKRYGYLIIGLDTSDALGASDNNNGDDIGLILRDSRTGEVVGGGKYNETNLALFADFLVDILEQFPNSILIPERRSSATAILDFMFQIMIAKNMNPFKRIFNLIINDDDIDINIKKELIDRMPTLQLLAKYKRKFGYATSGTGSQSRGLLYGTIFKSALNYTSNSVRYSDLVDQLAGLQIRNNRIDHAEGSHDDLVIAWLLGMYLILMGKNTYYYGIKEEHKLNIIIDNEVTADGKQKEKVQKQIKIKHDLEYLLNQLRNINNETIALKYINKIRKLESQLDTSIVTTLNIDNILKNIKIAKRVLKRHNL